MRAILRNYVTLNRSLPEFLRLVLYLHTCVYICIPIYHINFIGFLKSCRDWENAFVLGLFDNCENEVDEEEEAEAEEIEEAA